MWWGAVLESIEQEAELLLSLLVTDSHDIEDALLHVLLVDTDGAAANLVAVADNVIGVRQRLARVLVKVVQVLRLRGGKGVVNRGPLGVAQCRRQKRSHQRKVQKAERLQPR